MNDLIDQTQASTTRRKRVAFLTDQENDDSTQQSEPWHALEQAGAEPVSLPHQRAADASIDDYDALVVPGDGAQPDDATRHFIRQFGASGKPVGALRQPEWLQQCIPTESLITGERPDDVPGFNNALLESIAHGDAGTT